MKSRGDMGPVEGARLATMVYSTFYDIMIGKTKGPKAENVAKIAAGFRVPLDWLMGEGQDEVPQLVLLDGRNRAHELIGRVSAEGVTGRKGLIRVLEEASVASWTVEELQTALKWAVHQVRIGLGTDDEGPDEGLGKGTKPRPKPGGPSVAADVDAVISERKKRGSG